MVERVKGGSALAALGYGAGERVVVVHADDVGMSQASVAAWEELAADGLLSSAAAMVTCPWFPRVAELARARPELDLGVHLTLTSEWPGCRWRPLSHPDRASGLLDAHGYFHATREALYRHAQPAAVAREIAAQLDCAYAAGLDVTHLDSHMYALARLDLLPLYLELGLDRGLPAIVAAAGLPVPDAATEEDGRRLVGAFRERGALAVDHIAIPRLDGSAAAGKRMLDALQPGLTHLLVHPACDTPELRAMARDWPRRVADYVTLMHPAVRRHAEAAGVRVVGYRALRDALRRPPPSGWPPG
jgi:YdjC-like protein